MESANYYAIAGSSFRFQDSDTPTTYNIRQQDMYSQNLVVKSLDGQWEMEQGFSYSINAGISYRFGSKNNNAVNPRFGY